MSRPGVLEGIKMLGDVQWRRENKAILDRLDSLKKESDEKSTENRRQHDILTQSNAAVKQELIELRESSVLRQEFEAHKELMKAREDMDSFLATGIMEEVEKERAEQRIAAREEQRNHAVDKSPIPLARSKPIEIETQLLPRWKPYASPFLRSDENQTQAAEVGPEPSTPELRAMVGQLSPGTTEDLSDDEQHNPYDGFDAFGERDRRDQVNETPRDITYDGGTRSSEEHGDWHNLRARKRDDLSRHIPQDMIRREGVRLHDENAHRGPTRRVDGADIHKRMAAVPVRPPMFGQPSKRTAGINPFAERPYSFPSASENRLKRPYDVTSNVSLRVTEHIAEQERKKAKNLSPAKQHRVSGSTPPEHGTVPEEYVEPPPRPHKPLPKPITMGRKTRAKPAPGPITPAALRPVYETISRPISNPDPKPAAKLPRLVQGKTPLAKYYKDANEAFLAYGREDELGQQEFVNRFLAGIHLKKHRDEAIAMLQQKEESTVKNQQPWILCEWKNVLRSLVLAKLVKKKDVD